MFRRGKIKQSTFLIALFFITASSLFGIFILLFLSGLNNNHGDNRIYTITDGEYASIFKNEGTLKIDFSRLTLEQDYKNNHLLSYSANFTIFTFSFFCLLFLFSVGLWLVLRKTKKNELTSIVADLDMIFDNYLVINDPILSPVYDRLIQKFSDRLSDYKRLNDYLSHDQKNTLAFLRSEMELSDNTKLLVVLDSISDSIDNILTLSENIDHTLLTKVDVSLICAEVCDQYKKIYRNIIFDFDESENTEILARERWLYRMFANLIDNAIKYGRNRPIKVSVKESKGSVIITVKDNGIGIKDEELDKIFNDRYRVNELNKKGYGIGLSLVSHVCDLCGGFIVVESEISKGTKFYIAFPKSN